MYIVYTYRCYVQWYCESYSVICTLKFLHVSVNCLVIPHFLRSLCLYPQLISSKSILNPTRIVININTFRSFQCWEKKFHRIFVLLSGYNKNYHISTVNYYAILEMKWLDGICAKVGRSDCWKSKVRSKFLNVTFLKSSLPPLLFPPFPSLPLCSITVSYTYSLELHYRKSETFCECSGFLLTATALQMKGWWESNINVWFRFMYSQKWNCTAKLFPKQNHNVLSPNFHIQVYVSDFYISRIVHPILLQPNSLIRLPLRIYKLLTDTWM